MFWQRFSSLCIAKGKAPNAVAKELGISSGAITAWSKGAVPRNATIVKIADYFSVTTDYLLATDTKKVPTLPQESEPDPAIARASELLAQCSTGEKAMFLAMLEKFVEDRKEGGV